MIILLILLDNGLNGKSIYSGGWGNSALGATFKILGAVFLTNGFFDP